MTTLTLIDGAALLAVGRLRQDAATGVAQADANADLIAGLPINPVSTSLLTASQIDQAAGTPCPPTRG
ncbi:MAG: hypothetical protein ACD_54C00221G0004 [uncultured bacterium]|nr:MAG: hypothetical protein ACD_54C00221G0004 [uncultured bacterium]